MSWTRGRPNSSIVPPPLHRRVIRVYGPDCYRCGAPYAEIDHVIPWSTGGGNTIDNLRPICRACHDTKSEQERKAGYQRRQAKKRRPRDPHPSEARRLP